MYAYFIIFLECFQLFCCAHMDIFTSDIKYFLDVLATFGHLCISIFYFCVCVELFIIFFFHFYFFVYYYYYFKADRWQRERTLHIFVNLVIIIYYFFNHFMILRTQKNSYFGLKCNNVVFPTFFTLSTRQTIYLLFHFKSAKLLGLNIRKIAEL